MNIVRGRVIISGLRGTSKLAQSVGLWVIFPDLCQLTRPHFGGRKASRLPHWAESDVSLLTLLASTFCIYLLHRLTYLERTCEAVSVVSNLQQ